MKNNKKHQVLTDAFYYANKLFFIKKIIKMVDFRKNKLYNVFVNNFIKNQKNEIIIKVQSNMKFDYSIFYQVNSKKKK